MTDTHTLPARRPIQIHTADAETQPGRPARNASLRSTGVAASPAPAASAMPAPALPPPALPSWNLTPQQWRVFLLVGRALSNKAIAHELKVAESTVKAHISAIFKVSGCRNRTEAALLSLRVRYGLLEPEAEARGSMAALDYLRRQTKARKSA
jgi:DNA-binding CsgD family transcriptional regulator